MIAKNNSRRNIESIIGELWDTQRAKTRKKSYSLLREK